MQIMVVCFCRDLYKHFLEPFPSDPLPLLSSYVVLGTCPSGITAQPVLEDGGKAVEN